ncbi:hypothetical protein, partial [Salmonella sp. SAL4433]|uniref:hypothetical protein n=1 Tax=Salmonella sp. SAL4433 TaxID=3159888 RepID=UPI00397E51D3
EQYQLESARSAHLVQADTTQLSTADWDTIWQASVYKLLRDRVGSNAAELYRQDRNPANAASNQETGRGILSLTVRSRNDRVFGPLLG